jgi:signal transduction histidine kinase
VVLVPHGGPIDELQSQQVALETTGTLITSLAAFIVFGRLRRDSRLDELALVVALSVIALTNVFFVLLPMLTGPATTNPEVGAAIIGRALGGLLFAAAAFVPRVSLRRPRRAQVLAAACVLSTLVLTAVLPRVFGSSLGQAIARSAAPHVHYGPGASPALMAVQVMSAVLAVVAAAGYLRRSERLGDEFSGWLAMTAVFAVASHVEYALGSAIYSPLVSLGDVFRLCSYVVLITGLMREIWSYWHELASAIVAEERRRIARDLHDGLSQELAYLSRNLSGLQGTANAETLGRLRISIDRARLVTRQAVDRVGAPAQPPTADAITEAAGEVAERFGLDLDLDLDVAGGVGVPSARTDALVRIACEALTNAARHSGSSRVSLILRREEGHVHLRVRDWGKGFDAASCRAGFGLTSMRDRARSVGGELDITSEPGAGSQVEATL